MTLCIIYGTVTNKNFEMIVYLNNMKNGLHCSAGYNWFSIGSEGRVSTCNSLIYRKDAYLGNIIKDDIKLRTDEFGFRCPNQECLQVCDRHWARKKVYKNNIETDYQEIINLDPYQNKNRAVSILFAPTWKCNYSCKYCTLPTKETYPDIPDVCDQFNAEQWIEAFTRFFETNGIDGGIWHTNGGEPLYYNGIEKLFTFFSQKNFKIALTSNISADVFKKIVMAAPPESFGAINCSLHPTDKNFRWELYKSRVELLKSFNYPVSVNFVGHPDQLMLTQTYADWCNSIGVNFALIPMVGTFDDINFPTVEDYPLPLKNIIKKFTTKNLSDENKFIGGERIG